MHNSGTHYIAVNSLIILLINIIEIFLFTNIFQSNHPALCTVDAILVIDLCLFITTDCNTTCHNGNSEFLKCTVLPLDIIGSETDLFPLILWSNHLFSSLSPGWMNTWYFNQTNRVGLYDVQVRQNMKKARGERAFFSDKK